MSGWRSKPVGMARDGWPALLLLVLVSADVRAAGEKRRPAERPVVGSDADTTREARADARAVADSLERVLPSVLSTPSAPVAASLPVSSSAPETSPRATAAPRRKTLAYDLVRIATDVHVHDGDAVRGDVVVLGGNLRVDGEVAGGLVVFGGNIDLGPHALVGGEALAVGGRVDAAPGAEVRGGNVSLSVFPLPSASGIGWRRAQQLAALASDAMQWGLLLLLAAVLSLLLPRRMRAAREALERVPWRSLGLGTLAMTGGLFAVVMITVLLAITLVGLPLSLLVLVAALLLLGMALVVGLARLGSWALARARLRSPFVHSAVGLALWVLPDVTADLLRFREGAGDYSTLRIVHVAIGLVAMAAGLGAILVSRFGALPPAARAPVPGSLGEIPRAA